MRKSISKVALFSVDNFDRVVEFAKRLICMGWKILATSELEQDSRHSTISDELRKNLINKAYAFIANHYLSQIQYQSLLPK